MTTKHLTQDQRDQLRALADECDLRELLLAVAGIVRHDVEDFARAEDTADLINRAANVLVGR